MSERYTLRVNGRDREIDGAWLGESLLYVLRERLELPGSKSGCEQGECGSCSVLVDGALVCSCLVLAAAATGSEIVTVEGLGGPDDPLTAVQDAFDDEGRPHDPEYGRRAVRFLDEFEWYANALKAARAGGVPY